MSSYLSEAYEDVSRWLTPMKPTMFNSSISKIWGGLGDGYRYNDNNNKKRIQPGDEQYTLSLANDYSL